VEWGSFRKAHSGWGGEQQKLQNLSDGRHVECHQSSGKKHCFALLLATATQLPFPESLNLASVVECHKHASQHNHYQKSLPDEILLGLVMPDPPDIARHVNLSAFCHHWWAGLAYRRALSCHLRGSTCACSMPMATTSPRR